MTDISDRFTLRLYRHYSFHSYFTFRARLRLHYCNIRFLGDFKTPGGSRDTGILVGYKTGYENNIANFHLNHIVQDFSRGFS